MRVLTPISYSTITFGILSHLPIIWGTAVFYRSLIHFLNILQFWDLIYRLFSFLNFPKRNIGRFCDFLKYSSAFKAIVKANLLLARNDIFFFLILLLICIKIGLSHELLQFRWFVQFSVRIMACLSILIIL